MKYSNVEMAIRIICENSDETSELCAMGFPNGPHSVVVYCDHPEKLVIPKDDDEQWYYNTKSGFTNKHHTKDGNSANVEVHPFSDLDTERKFRKIFSSES